MELADGISEAVPPPTGSVDSKEKAFGPPKVKVCSPAVSPVGTTNTMAYRPLRVGASPANEGAAAGTPPMLTVIGLVALLRVSDGPGAPSATAGDTSPNPVT